MNQSAKEERFRKQMEECYKLRQTAMDAADNLNLLVNLMRAENPSRDLPPKLLITQR